MRHAHVLGAVVAVVAAAGHRVHGPAMLALEEGHAPCARPGRRSTAAQTITAVGDDTMRHVWGRRHLAVVVVLVACGQAPPPAADVTADGGSAHSASGAPTPAAPIVGPEEIVVSRPPGGLGAFEGDCLVSGGTRVCKRRDGGYDVGADRFHGYVRRMNRVGAGVVFLTDDGVVARSATFLGALERVGQVDRSDQLVSDADRIVLLRDGALEVAGDRALVVTKAGAVQSAAFTDGCGGAVADGRLYRTIDAGASWTRVPTPGFVPGALDAEEYWGYIIVEHREPSAGGRYLTRTGLENEPPPLPPGAPFGGPPAPDTPFEVLCSHDLLGCRAVEWDDQGRAIVLGPGAVLRCTGSECAPIEGTRRGFFELARWNGKLVLVGSDVRDLDAPRVTISDDELDRPLEWNDAAFAARAPTAVVPRGCESIPDTNDRACREIVVTEDRGRRLRTLMPQRPVRTMLGTDGAKLLVLTAPTERRQNPSDGVPLALRDVRPIDMTLPVADVAIIDLRTGQMSPVALPASLTRARFVQGGVTEDGTFWLSLAGTSSGAVMPAFVTGRGGSFDVLPLPPRARTAALRDARHGVAAGATFEDVWTTEDGGRSWRRIDVPVEGDARRTYFRSVSEVHDELPLRGSEEDFPPISCSRRHCTIDARVSIGVGIAALKAPGRLFSLAR